MFLLNSFQLLVVVSDYGMFHISCFQYSMCKRQLQGANNWFPMHCQTKTFKILINYDFFLPNSELTSVNAAATFRLHGSSILFDYFWLGFREEYPNSHMLSIVRTLLNVCCFLPHDCQLTHPWDDIILISSNARKSLLYSRWLQGVWWSQFLWYAKLWMSPSYPSTTPFTLLTDLFWLIRITSEG